MNPQQPIQPAPTQQSPQGVTSVAPVGAPTPPQLPTAPTPQALPQPLQNPSFNPSAGLDTIANFYKIPREQAINVAQTQAQGNVAQQQTSLQRSNAERQLDPGNYKVIPAPGAKYGVNIIGPTGQPVDIGTYVNLTGANPAQVLAKSTDPEAQKFVQAYNNFEDLMQTTLGASNGDQAAKARLGDYYESNPGLKDMKLQDVSNLFMQRYGQFFGMPQQQAPNTPNVNPTFQSANNPVTTSPYYNQNFQNEFAANPYQQSGSSDLTAMLQQLQSQQGG